MGRTIVVHFDPDDGVMQPTGNSGMPVMCGVIEKAPPAASDVGG